MNTDVEGGWTGVTDRIPRHACPQHVPQEVPNDHSRAPRALRGVRYHPQDPPDIVRGCGRSPGAGAAVGVCMRVGVRLGIVHIGRGVRVWAWEGVLGASALGGWGWGWGWGWVWGWG